MHARSDQSFLRYPLTRILGSPGNLRVVRALLASSSPRSVTQLADATGLTAQGVRHVMGALLRARVIEAAGSGRSVVYFINAGHPLMPVLRQVFAAERNHWARLLDAVRGVLEERSSVQAAWYYGSGARGEDQPGSDFDVAIYVVGANVERVLDGVRDALRPVEDAFDISFSVVGLSSDDIARHAAQEPSVETWWGSMLRDARILKGPHPKQLAAELVDRAVA